MVAGGVGYLFRKAKLDAGPLVMAFILAGRPELTRSVVIAVLLVGGVVIIAAGIAGGVAGEQTGEEHGAGIAPTVVVDSASGSGAVDTLTLLAGE